MQRLLLLALASTFHAAPPLPSEPSIAVGAVGIAPQHSLILSSTGQPTNRSETQSQILESKGVQKVSNYEGTLSQCQ